MTHEMIAAGPAVIRAFGAPNSQPEAMIDPTDAHSRPISPISRLSETGRRRRCSCRLEDITISKCRNLRHTATRGTALPHRFVRSVALTGNQTRYPVGRNFTPRRARIWLPGRPASARWDSLHRDRVEALP